MISKDDIKKLADLARIDIKDEEQEELAREIDSILAYVGQVSEVVSGPLFNVKRDGEIRVGGGVNVWREDTDPTPSGTYNKELIAEFPNSENNYLKVKKIL